MRRGTLALLILVAVGGAPAPVAATPARARSVSPRVHEATDLGRAPASGRHRVVVALALRNRAALDAFLADVQDPASPRYGQFIGQDEFNALYAPRPEDEQAVVDHLRGGGLRVTGRYANRLVVGAVGNVAALERTFGVEIHRVGLDGRRHYAAMSEPTFPAAIGGSIVGVIGLDDLAERRPHVRQVGPAVAPRAALGSNCCHLGPNDLFVFYDGSATYPGTGQTLVIAGAYAWKDTDNAAFSTQWALPPLPAGSGQVCIGPAGSSGCRYSSQQSIEIALDVEYAHGTAPGARILNYMAASTSFADFTTMYNRIVTDNPGRVVSTSWGACEAGIASATQQADDDIFANANAIGQSWFAASGDSGSRDCSGLLTVDNPANSPHVVGVGGTTPTCSAGMQPGTPGCGGYGSETGWSGSGGGASSLFARPAFQAGCGVPSGTKRLVPDVALEADTSPGNYVVHGGGWYIVGGTSGAAPQWAAVAAQLNQKQGGALGNPGALLYGLCGTSAFHDVTSGSNGDYAAAPGYDLVTGLGTVSVQNLLAAVGGGATTSSTSSSTTSSTSTTVVATTSTAITSSTTSTTTTFTTTTSSSSTTTLGSCGAAGSSCVQNGDCCSNACKGKPGAKVCR